MLRGRWSTDKVKRREWRREKKSTKYWKWQKKRERTRSEWNERLKCLRERGKRRKRGHHYFSGFVEFGRECSIDSRTRVLNVAQCWQRCVWVHLVGARNFVTQRNTAIQRKKNKINKQQSPSHLIYPTSAHIPHSPYSLNSHEPIVLYTFSASWDSLQHTANHDTWNNCCDICLICIWSAPHVHLLTLNIFCGVT